MAGFRNPVQPGSAERVLSAAARAGGRAGSLPGFPTPAHSPSARPCRSQCCFIGTLPSFFPDKGSIHKIVELPDGVQNIMELQVFPKKDPIQSMIVDHKRVSLCLLRQAAALKADSRGGRGR